MAKFGLKNQNRIEQKAKLITTKKNWGKLTLEKKIEDLHERLIEAGL